MKKSLIVLLFFIGTMTCLAQNINVSDTSKTISKTEESLLNKKPALPEGRAGFQIVYGVLMALSILSKSSSPLVGVKFKSLEISLTESDELTGLVFPTAVFGAVSVPL